MSNTIILNDLLQKETIKQLDRNTVITPWANRKYEGQLKRMGDTVKVQVFPNRRPQRDGTAGADITSRDFAVTSDTLKVNQIVQDNAAVTDLEEIRASIEGGLGYQLIDRFGEAIAQAHENHIALTAVKGAHTDNILNAGSPVALSASTVYAQVEALRTTVAKKNVYGEMALFVNPHTSSLLRQSSLLDGFNEGWLARKGSMVPSLNGIVGSVSKFIVYETNNLPFKQKLTVDTNPTADDTVTISVIDVETETTTTITWTWKASASAAGQITIGATAAASQTNLYNAILGSGTGFVDVSTANRALLKEYEISLSAFSSNVAYFHANREITLGETFTAATNIFGTASVVMFCLDREAVNFVHQFSGGPEARKAVNGFRSQVLYENVYQAGVLGLNGKRIGTKEITIQ